MQSLLNQIALCVERGKADADSSYPPDMQGEEGASELAARALSTGVPADRVLAEGLIPGMHAVGEKFSAGTAFIPELLIAAKAMTAAMEHLRPYFESGEARHRGTFVVGTVAGDLHDIGKRIVAMVMEGNGWKVVDLGTNVAAETFLGEVGNHPGCVVGLSSLLTTTMPTMEATVQTLKARHPEVRVFVGGAPITAEFSDRIGADGYFPDPHGLVEHIRGNG